MPPSCFALIQGTDFRGQIPKTHIMATFHAFPRFPFELRAMIWKSTVEPRTVEVSAAMIRKFNFEPRTVEVSVKKYRRIRPIHRIRLTTATPVPAALQVCQEARNLGLYQKAFSEIDPERYVWLNLDMDTVDIGRTNLGLFEKVQLTIKRLRLYRSWFDEGWNRWEINNVSGFANLQTVQIDIDGFRDMYGVLEDVDHFPCGPENVFFIHPDSGQMLSSIELQILNEREWKRIEEREPGEPTTYPYDQLLP